MNTSEMLRLTAWLSKIIWGSVTHPLELCLFLLVHLHAHLQSTKQQLLHTKCYYSDKISLGNKLPYINSNIIMF